MLIALMASASARSNRLHAFFNRPREFLLADESRAAYLNPGQIAERKVVLRIRSGAGCSGPMRATRLA